MGKFPGVVNSTTAAISASYGWNRPGDGNEEAELQARDIICRGLRNALTGLAPMEIICFTKELTQTPRVKLDSPGTSYGFPWRMYMTIGSISHYDPPRNPVSPDVTPSIGA